MSFPNEVWISYDKYGDLDYEFLYRNPEDAEKNADENFAGSLRYLRDDLACGECKHCSFLYDEYGRLMEYSKLCSKRMLDLLEGVYAPACMAFQPKED